MKNRKTNQVIAMLLAAIALTSGAGITAAAKTADEPAFKDEGTDSIIATVTEIDQKTREVTLRGPLGNSVSFIAGPDVKKLKQVRVGDKVHVDYTVSLAIELREPTAEEKAQPLSATNVTSRVAKGAPAGTAVEQVKAVVTIEGINRPTHTIVVKGPLGRYVMVRVADPARLEKLQIGQTIVLTYTESMAIKLEKVFSAKSGE